MLDGKELVKLSLLLICWIYCSAIKKMVFQFSDKVFMVELFSKPEGIWGCNDNLFVAFKNSCSHYSCMSPPTYLIFLLKVVVLWI